MRFKKIHSRSASNNHEMLIGCYNWVVWTDAMLQETLQESYSYCGLQFDQRSVSTKFCDVDELLQVAVSMDCWDEDEGILNQQHKNSNNLLW